jgi:hypothetical protein
LMADFCCSRSAAEMILSMPLVAPDLGHEHRAADAATIIHAGHGDPLHFVSRYGAAIQVLLDNFLDVRFCEINTHSRTPFS